jgi:signal transduction histidine kinase
MVYNSGLTALGGVYGKFLLLTQIQTSGTNKNASTFSIKSKIDRAISVRMDKIKTKNITIENNISDADITQNISLFTFVVGTLIDNAVKFSNQNGKVVISGSADSKDKTVRLKFSDNGQGIDPDKLNQLFKPFSRAESAVQFSYEGLGLSLFLCRLIVNYMGGTISATSELGQGTEIAVTVPVGDNQ